MEDIILVTGCDRTRSWTNIAFLEGQVDAKGTYREKVVERADGSIEVRFSSGHVAGGVLSHGPQGKVRRRTVDRPQWVVSHDLVSTRTYPRINLYLSGGFVSLLLPKYSQSVLERRRIPLQTQRDTTISQLHNLRQYPQLQG
jgi:hypothetical protein